jgi:hypothetical protein
MLGMILNAQEIDTQNLGQGYSLPIQENPEFRNRNLVIKIASVGHAEYGKHPVEPKKNDALTILIDLPEGKCAYDYYEGEICQKILDFSRIDELKGKKWYYVEPYDSNNNNIHLLRPVLPEDNEPATT